MALILYPDGTSKEAPIGTSYFFVRIATSRPIDVKSGVKLRFLLRAWRVNGGGELFSWLWLTLREAG